MAHMVFFSLADATEAMIKQYEGYCYQYLSGHPGQVHFSVGARVVDIQRDVSASDFDVAMHIIFDSRKSYNAYAKSSRHEEFITQTAGLSNGRRVFDTYLAAKGSVIFLGQNA